MIFIVFITFLSLAPRACAHSELEALQAGSRWDESERAGGKARMKYPKNPVNSV